MTVTAEKPAVQAPVVVQPTRIELPYVDLLELFATLKLGVPSRPVLPVLGGVLVQAVAGTVTFSTYDFETHITVVAADAASGPDVTVLVDFAELNMLLPALVKGLPSRDRAALTAVLQVTETTADLTLNGYDTPVHVWDRNDYPNLPDIPQPTYELPLTDLVATVARVVVARGTTEGALPMLAGVYLAVNALQAELAGTDRYRLARARIRSVATSNDAVPFQAILPGAEFAKLAARLGKLGLDDTTPVRVGCSSQEVSVQAGNVTASFRLIDAQFPRYNLLIPTEASATVTVDRKAFLLAVQRAEAVFKAKQANECGDPVAEVALADGAVSVRPRLQTGEVKAPQMPAVTDHVAGLEWTSIGFNLHFLAAALNNFTDQQVTVHLNHSNHKPVLITAADDTLNADYLHLLMPVKLNR